MFSPDGRVVLVFNGELYNYLDLRSELSAAGYNFRSNTDTEVLLALYLSLRGEAEGEIDSCLTSKMLSRLNGIFAFALWDSDINALLLARDALGVKPLYVQHSGNQLYFASEAKALPRVSLSIDHAALDRYMTFLWCPAHGSPAKS